MRKWIMLNKGEKKKVASLSLAVLVLQIPDLISLPFVMGSAVCQGK